MRKLHNNTTKLRHN